jgi:hypothetical protein
MACGCKSKKQQAAKAAERQAKIEAARAAKK